MNRTLLSWLLSCVTGLAAEEAALKRSSTVRLETAHLKAVHEQRETWTKLRKEQPGTGIFKDFRAVMHVHAEDSKHTGGTRQGVLEAAKRTGVQVVMLTDHRGPHPETWRGMHDGVLFIPGSEEEGLLRFPTVDHATGEVLKEDLRFLCHIEERYDASSEGFQGMEICNRHTDAKDDLEYLAWFGNRVKDKEHWSEFVDLYKQYPDEIFGAGTRYWPEIMSKWDKETKTKAFTGIGANDAHENQVFNGLMIDPYEVSFRNLSTHILARDLADSSIRQSLREGHVYVSHDWLCDATSFDFVAANNLGVFNMGDSVPVVGNTRLIAQAPIAARIRLFQNGTMKEEKTGDRVTFETKEAGVYRVEAWLDVDGEARPWIYSNPIYLKALGLLSMKLPSMETLSNVEVKKGITYTEGDPADPEKHKLDLYLPKGKTSFPVFFFIHGGAWVSGDRSQYPPLGNRYASEGIGVVVPSYRLAPKHPHPAQIDDVAAAFAWTIKNVANYGGETNRVYVGGHSAGGHLAALLTLDPTYLKKYGLSSDQIHGTICLSGVFDVADVKEKVFGKDAEIHKAASPINHINNHAPPFLITYCEWDYFPLAVQAQEFHLSLQKHGLSSKLLYVPKESHISEMLEVSQKDDLTVSSVLNFLRSSVP